MIDHLVTEASDAAERGLDMLSLLSPDFVAGRDRLREAFQESGPFPHVMIPQLLDDNFCRELLDQFPPTQPEVLAAHEANGGRGGKSKVQDLPGIGGPYRRLDALLRSAEFIDLLSSLTGIRGLLFDPDYYGGGTHESLHGEGLLPHIDFNFYPGRPWYRRLNLLLYLNPVWDESWGGLLELCKDPRNPMSDERKLCPIGFNSAVLLATTNRSWHGFRSIGLPPDQRHLTRKSVAVYYYTDYVPDDDTPLNRSTVYIEQPLPPTIRAGLPLTEDDLHSMRDALQLRGWHIQELGQEMLMHGWTTLARLKPGSSLNHQEITQFRVLLAASDHIVRSFERERLRLRNPGREVDLSAIGDRARIPGGGRLSGIISSVLRRAGLTSHDDRGAGPGNR